MYQFSDIRSVQQHESQSCPWTAVQGHDGSSAGVGTMGMPVENHGNASGKAGVLLKGPQNTINYAQELAPFNQPPIKVIDASVASESPEVIFLSRVSPFGVLVAYCL
jgi:hypothetical protein